MRFREEQSEYWEKSQLKLYFEDLGEQDSIGKKQSDEVFTE